MKKVLLSSILLAGVVSQAQCLTGLNVNPGSVTNEFNVNMDFTNGVDSGQVANATIFWTVDGVNVPGYSALSYSSVFSVGTHDVCAAYINPVTSCNDTVCATIVISGAPTGGTGTDSVNVDGTIFGNWYNTPFDSIYVDSALLDEISNFDYTTWSDSLIISFFGDDLNFDVSTLDSNDNYVFDIDNSLTQTEIDSLNLLGITVINTSDFQIFWTDFLNNTPTFGLTVDELIALFGTSLQARLANSVSIEELPKELLSSFNPETNVVFFNANTFQSVSVFSISGQLIEKHNIQNNNSVQLSISDRGVYILLLNDGVRNLTQKIIK